MRIKSEYALLDVTYGRKTLDKHFKRGGKSIPVIIYGEITDSFGHDDGESVEFNVIVNKLQIEK